MLVIKSLARSLLRSKTYSPARCGTCYSFVSLVVKSFVRSFANSIVNSFVNYMAMPIFNSFDCSIVIPFVNSFVTSITNSRIPKKKLINLRAGLMNNLHPGFPVVRYWPKLAANTLDNLDPGCPIVT